jgi:hypothetical protein
MTIGQLSDLRQWHAQHRWRHPLESECWDLMLTLWVLGTVGLPVSLMLRSALATTASLLALAAPSAYVGLRRHLHRRHRLRCDWLGASPRQGRQRQS